MPTREEGSIPQGLIEQARARSVDPGKLKLLGKQAAALHCNEGVTLNEAVPRVIGHEDLGTEHIRRVCEFANQEAYRQEWEKGGSVRNVEFDGGPADPSVILKSMNDGAREETTRVVTDYDTPPVKLSHDRNRPVEEEIFGKYASATPMAMDLPTGTNDLHRLHTRLNGAVDHVHSKISGLEVTKEALALELSQAASNAILEGTDLTKIAAAWSHFCSDRDIFQEALTLTAERALERGIVPAKLMDMEKVAEIGHIVNAAHPLVSRFIEFSKVAAELKKLQGAQTVLKEKVAQVRPVLREAIT